MSIKIIPTKCTGCEACINACPYGAIKIKGNIAHLLDNCTSCMACIRECPTGAIVLKDPGSYQEQPRTLIEQGTGVWIFVEQRHGIPAGVVYELLGRGQALAHDLGEELCAVLLGYNIEFIAGKLAKYGADKIYIVDDKALSDFEDEPYAQVIAGLVTEFKPSIFLFGATTIGRSLAPRIAAKLGTGLTADCTELSIDKKDRLLLQTRPAFGGNIMATIICPDKRPQMATVRPKVMKPAEHNQAQTGKIIRIVQEIAPSRAKFLETYKTPGQQENIQEADIVVSGGRGIGEPGNFRLLQELAALLGGAVGASRAAVDAGWVPYANQVGQTGKTVRPKLYIACGISGAVQHLVGMSSSDVIVAINNDPNAPIFSVATYGIVGDVLEIVPALISKLRGSSS